MRLSMEMMTSSTPPFQLQSTIFTKPNKNFQTPFRNLSNKITTHNRKNSSVVAVPRISFSNSHNFATACSFTDAATTTTTTSSVTEVAEADLSLQIKKRAADISPELKGTSIFLVGMKSSVKTGLAKLLADSLRYYFFDSDGLVEEAAGGASAAKSLKESDEKAFRECETEVLKQLSSMGRLVVCAGDGAVQSSTNLALLRHGISLWIDVPLDIVAAETVEGQNQQSEEISEELIEAYHELKGGYATADATISLQKVAVRLGYDDLNSVTTEDMTLEALSEIERLTRVKKMMEEAARPF